MKQVLIFGMLLAIVGMGLAIFLVMADRLPERELELVWSRVSTGTSEIRKEPEPEAPPTEEPTFDQVVRARAIESREISRQKQEVTNLLNLAEARQKELDARQQALNKAQAELKKTYEEKQDAAVQAGRQNLLLKLESMSPKLSKEFLLTQAEREEDVALELMKKLDPVLASKIFKEFKAPAEIDKLNQLLVKIGQGEPEISALQP